MANHNPAESILSKLEKVRQIGDGKCMACCPAHDDKTPSLSVRDTGENMLIHCFAGCCADDVLATVGLTWRDLYRDEGKASFVAAASAASRIIKPPAQIDIERRILQIAAADLRAGLTLSAEDRARVALAKERVEGLA